MIWLDLELPIQNPPALPGSGGVGSGASNSDAALNPLYHEILRVRFIL